MEFLKNMLYGLLIGTANIIPGVSGGTMAVVLNIYDQLIGAVSDLRRKFRDSLRLLIPIGLGAVIGIVAFSKLIKFLLGAYPAPTNFFFLGLVIGSIPLIYKRAANQKKLQTVHFVPFLAALAVMLFMTLLPANDGAGALITSLTPVNAVWLVLCGAIAAASMILPGVSGSMVMMILGVYTSILTAISDFNILLLIPVGVGILAGLFGGAKIIGLCMSRFPQGTYFAILGLIVGSIYPVFRNAEFHLNLQGGVAIVMLCLGTVCTIFMERLQKKLEQAASSKRSGGENLAG